MPSLEQRLRGAIGVHPDVHEHEIRHAARQRLEPTRLEHRRQGARLPPGLRSGALRLRPRRRGSRARRPARLPRRRTHAGPFASPRRRPPARRRSRPGGPPARRASRMSAAPARRLPAARDRRSRRAGRKARDSRSTPRRSPAVRPREARGRRRADRRVPSPAPSGCSALRGRAAASVASPPLSSPRGRRQPSRSGTVTTTASRFCGSRTKLGNDGQDTTTSSPGSSTAWQT